MVLVRKCGDSRRLESLATALICFFDLSHGWGFCSTRFAFSNIVVYFVDMYKKLFLFLNIIIGFSLFFSFGVPAEAALQCTGQWPGSKVDFYIKQGGSGGPVIAEYHYDDLGSSGWSGGTESINVDSGTVLYFEGYATAPDQFSPSTWESPYNHFKTFREGVFPVKRWDISEPITSSTYFHWVIDGWCNTTPDPDWHGGLFDLYININVNTPPVATICTAVYGAPSAHFALTDPNGVTDGHDTNSYCTDAPAGTWSISQLTPLAGYEGPFLKAPGTGQTVDIGASQTVGDGGWIGWDILYIQKKYRCDGGGSCIQDNVNGNTTSPTCNNSCVVPPGTPTASMSASPTSVVTGGSSTITWSSNDATSCTVTPGGWTGTSGSQSTGALASNTTYTVNCTGSGGNASASATVTVTSSPMSGTLTGPSGCIIASGGNSCTVTLNWSVTNPATTPTKITATGMSDIVVSNTTATPQSGSRSVTVPAGNRNFYLYNNTTPLVGPVLVTSACVSGTSWNGSSCAVVSGYILRVTKTAGGSVNSTSDSSITCGSTCESTYTSPTVVTLQAYPSSTYWQFSGWSGDCTGTGLCTLNVNSVKNVNATFTLRSFQYIEF